MNVEQGGIKYEFLSIGIYIYIYIFINIYIYNVHILQSVKAFQKRVLRFDS